MAATLEGCGNKDVYDFNGSMKAYETCRQAHNVCIIMLPGKFGYVFLPTDCCTNTLVFIGSIQRLGDSTGRLANV